MKRERLFYLDFIRAIATVLIVITHYNALYLYNVPMQRPEMAIISMRISNIYIGAFGVTLFLIISGAALMHVYGNREKLDLKRFYKKRFLTIFPMFWLAYLAAFFYSFFTYGGLDSTTPRANIIYSILGVDGLLLNYGIPTFYRVGEWFLGFIIIIYVIFPLFLYLINRAPWVFGMIVVAAYVIGLIFDGRSVSVLVRLPEIAFGMYFIKYIKNVKWYVALPAFAVLVANTLIAPPISENIQTTYVGICAFLVLVFLSKYLTFHAVKRVCATICKYSYACFLCHHYLIYLIFPKFNLAIIGRGTGFLLFLTCCAAIIICSYLLHHVSEKMVAYITSLFPKKEPALQEKAT